MTQKNKQLIGLNLLRRVTTVMLSIPKTEINDKECPKISIGFSFTDVCGNNYSANTRVGIISDIESEIDDIGYQFNAFLSQCGYVRKNQFMLMKDLTEEEVELLTVYLDEIRNKRKVADKE